MTFSQLTLSIAPFRGPITVRMIESPQYKGEVPMNKLYFGDNLVVLREHIADGSIDDPVPHASRTKPVRADKQPGKEPKTTPINVPGCYVPYA